MKDAFSSRLFHYTDREEIANRWTHIPAVAIFLGGAGMLIVRAAETGDPYRIVSASIFAICLTGPTSDLFIVRGRTGYGRSIRRVDPNGDEAARVVPAIFKRFVEP